MKRIVLTASLVFAALGALIVGASAQTYLWVASNGSGSTCTRTAPCATFQAAHDASANTDIVVGCVDPGSYGAVTITKSITIDCANVTAFANSVLITGTSTTAVRLRGLQLNGAGISGNASTGISGYSGASLSIEKCVIANYSNVGVVFLDQSAYVTRLSITDSVIKNNPTGLNFLGSGGSQTTRVTVARTLIDGNGYGINVQGQAASTGILAMVVTDSVISSSSTAGVNAFNQTGYARASVTLDRTVVSGTTSFGIYANGPQAYIVLSDTTVIANGVGLAEFSGGYILSYRNNALLGNIVDGSPTAYTNLN
jgi:hypothetical protein